jgi:8-oxo-dGTP diphosphatase
LDPIEGAITFTLCFLTRADQVLLLKRRHPPNQGLWNGVGGHVEPGEAPLASCLREVREETGYCLATARFGGILTWRGFEIPPGGLYLYTASAPAGEPGPCDEGQLQWHAWPWLFTAPEVVSNLHHVGPHLLAGDPPQDYHFEYAQGRITRHVVRRLPEALGRLAAGAGAPG